jgi:hypothetical protein
LTHEHIDRHVDTSYSSSSILKKTTTNPHDLSDEVKIIAEIMNSDPEYTYWQEQQVSPTQVNRWINEFGLDLQTMLNNLCYVRWQIINQKSEIKKSPADFVYGIMKKNGGSVNKPAGYKSLAQQNLEFYENWKKQRIEYTVKIEQLKKEGIKAEIEPQVTEILETLDLDNEYLQAALDLIYSKKRKQTIVSMIKSGKSLDGKSESVLKGYLEKILSKEVSVT